MALAPLDRLPRVAASRSAAFRGFDGLTVDYAGERRFVPSGDEPVCHRQSLIDRDDQAPVAPAVEIVLHGWVGWKILGQQTPLATVRRHILNRVPSRPARMFRPPADAGATFDERLHDRPFLVGDIACITQPASVMLWVCDFGPGHWIPRSARNTPRITTR